MIQVAISEEMSDYLAHNVDWSDPELHFDLFSAYLEIRYEASDSLRAAYEILHYFLHNQVEELEHEIFEIINQIACMEIINQIACMSMNSEEEE